MNWSVAETYIKQMERDGLWPPPKPMGDFELHMRLISDMGISNYLAMWEAAEAAFPANDEGGGNAQA